MCIVREFIEYSGLRIKLQKTAGIVSKIQPDARWSPTRCEGIEVRHFIKHLGIRLGNVITQKQRGKEFMGLTIDQAFSLAFQKSFRTARIACTMSFTLAERVLL